MTDVSPGPAWQVIAALLLAVVALGLALYAFAKTVRLERRHARLKERVTLLESAQLRSPGRAGNATQNPPTTAEEIPAAVAPADHPEKAQETRAGTEAQRQDEEKPNPAPAAISPAAPREAPPAPQPTTHYLPVGRDGAWKVADFKLQPGEYTQFVARVLGGKATFSLFEPNVRTHLLTRPTDYRSDFLQIEGTAGAHQLTELQPGRAVREGATWRLQQPLIIELR